MAAKDQIQSFIHNLLLAQIFWAWTDRHTRVIFAKPPPSQFHKVVAPP